MSLTSDLIELDAVLELLEDKKNRHQQEGNRLFGDNQFERASRHHFASIQIEKIIDLIGNLPKY